MSQYEELVELIQQGKLMETQDLVKALLAEEKSPDEIIQKGIAKALDIVGEKYSAGEYFLPELIVAGRASVKCLELLGPLLTKAHHEPKGKVVIGTVKGDLHDIGKNIVAMMLQGAGFHIVDLGINITPKEFVDSIIVEKPQILGMSCLLSTTLQSMERTMDALREAGLYGKVKVMIGGPPTSDDFARKIGADFRGIDAHDAVQQAKRFIAH